MKQNKTHLFIVVSSVALVAVLAIQVNWILQTARIKEQLFNEKANLVLSKTAEAFSADTGARQRPLGSVNDADVHQIDSLFAHYMQVYDIQIEYYFEVKPTPFAANVPTGFVTAAYTDPAGSYKTCMEDVSGKDALELKLVFPKKEQFILAEMGAPFIVSVVLILVVLVMSWRTLLSLLKEKKISEHTTDFLNNMTHEFKTPLTNIALAGKMMVKDSNIGQEGKIKHYSGIILEENEKLRHQVEQVLSMTALERGEIPLRKTELDAHELIRDALKYIGIQIETKQGSLHLNLDATHAWILGDKTHLTNALCNLIDNAIKYSPANPDLQIRTANNGQRLLVSVSDKGIGIDKEYQKQVFDTFFRVPTGDVHDVKGFGLGLAYVKKIVELHGGTIELQSEKGKGTTFTLTLPNA